MKIDYSDFFQTLESTPLEAWIELLPERIAHGLRYERHGLLPEWEEMLAKLPSLETAAIELKNEVRVDGDADPQLESLLKEFHPWRKGPYHIHDVHIDTEGRSDWKWDRVRPHLQPLDGRTILDVGCGSGKQCRAFHDYLDGDAQITGGDVAESGMRVRIVPLRILDRT